jgi:hypothetical protein
MANTKSAVVTNQEAGTFLDRPEMISDMHHALIHDETTAMAATETLELIQLPSSARIYDIRVAHDALGTTLTFDIGIGTINAGAAPTAVDADILVDGYDAAAAQIGWLTILGLGNTDPENVGKRLWELAGESVDPNVTYVIYLTCVTSGTPLVGSLAVLIDWASETGAG